MRICLECRRINTEDASICAGCGAVLQSAPKQREGSGITMFGSSPRKADITPLEKGDDPSTSAAAYGERREGNAVFESTKDQSTKPLGASFALKKNQPKKPWE